MSVTKYFSHSSSRTVWRLLINPADFLLIEERDTERSQTYFQCYDLKTGNRLMKNVQLSESFWIGIEEFDSDTIYFHRYVKPDMPWHCDIIAYSVSEERILWENRELVYGFLYNGNVYAYRQEFEGASFYVLDAGTGAVISELGMNAALINELKEQAMAARDFSNYRFPEVYHSGTDNKIDSLLAPLLTAAEGNLEAIQMSDIFFCTLHRRTPKGLYDHIMYGLDTRRDKVVFESTLSKGLERFTFDSFFIYKQYLITLLNKNQVTIYKLVI
ncbi:MAG: DUF4905 domain-containing protein [Ignavibacteria bacterium]|nr:DUF4905 domain-containing protein [Ignavibacteria bacterium]